MAPCRRATYRRVVESRSRLGSHARELAENVYIDPFSEESRATAGKITDWQSAPPKSVPCQRNGSTRSAIERWPTATVHAARTCDPG